MAEKATNTLLNQEQRTICQDIAAKKSGIDSQRAEALLAIDSGETQAKAAEISGLTAGQVRYLITNFKKKGLEIFPEELRTVEKPVEAAKEDTVQEETKVKKEKPAPKKAASKKKQKEPEEERPAPKKKAKKNEKKKKKAKRKQAKLSRKTSKSKKKAKGKKKKKKRSKK